MKVFVFLGHIWSRLPTVKFYVVLALLAKHTNGESFGWSCSFLAKDTIGESFFFQSFFFTNGERFVFSAFLGKISNGESFCFSWPYWAKVTTGEILFFMDTFWPRLLLLATLAVNTNDESYVCDLSFTFEQPLASHSAKCEFSFAGGNLWHPTVQAGVHVPRGNCWHGIGSTSILIHR